MSTRQLCWKRARCRTIFVLAIAALVSFAKAVLPELSKLPGLPKLPKRSKLPDLPKQPAQTQKKQVLVTRICFICASPPQLSPLPSPSPFPPLSPKILHLSDPRSFRRIHYPQVFAPGLRFDGIGELIVSQQLGFDGIVSLSKFHKLLGVFQLDTANPEVNGGPHYSTAHGGHLYRTKPAPPGTVAPPGYFVNRNTKWILMDKFVRWTKTPDETQLCLLLSTSSGIPITAKHVMSLTQQTHSECLWDCLDPRRGYRNGVSPGLRAARYDAARPARVAVLLQSRREKSGQEQL